MGKKENSKKYTEDLMEWQKKQYQPGVYTGGNFPPAIKYGGKKIGYLFIIQGILILFFGLAIFFETSYKIPGMLLFLLSIATVYGGINKVRRSKK